MPRPPNIPKRKLPTPVKLAPQQAQVANLIQQGLALHQQGKFKEAQVIYEHVLKIQSNHFDALQLLGTLSAQTKNALQAVEFLSKALQINPNNAACYNNRGNALKELKRLDEALSSYDKAIAIKPDYADAYYNRGIALQELKRLDEALSSYDKAIAIKPDYADAYYNRGNALQELKRLDEALSSYDQAIAIKPDYAEAYSNRGITLKELKRLDEALLSYDKALSIKPDSAFLLGDLLHVKMLVCQWDDFDNHKKLITQKMHIREKSSTPFPVLSLIDSPAIQKVCAEIYIKEKHPFNNTLGTIPKRTREQKIRIGYYSADFRNHPVSYLMAELLETHNKERFELFAFSFGPNKQDEMRSRLISAFDQFIDVRSKSDQEVAQLARDLEIDVAIDLGGFTGDSRTGIFAHRAAPIQLSYIGYLGTLGVEYFDYLIADKTIILARSQQHYSEKIIYLPSYQVNDRKRVISDKQFTRQELGLPENGFVFCCFNNNYKILPATFDGWMRILKAVEGSVLFLYVDNQWAEANLKNEAQARGVDPRRLIFGKHIPREEYLARYQSCDLFLDTLPYNAGTTASDALWAGLPVLTLMGESFASRVAASLLNAINLPELITTTQAEYEGLAIELATNPQKLAPIRQKLADNRLTTPLFDTPLFTKHIETAYTQMMERYWADLPPKHLYIEP